MNTRTPPDPRELASHPPNPIFEQDRSRYGWAFPAPLKRGPRRVPAVESMILQAWRAGYRRGMVWASVGSPVAGSLTLISPRRSSRITAPTAARAAQDIRKWWPHSRRATECGRAEVGGMRTRTTGRAGQQQARTPRAGARTSQSGRREAFRQPGRRGTSRRPWPCGAETSSTFDQRQRAASRLSRDFRHVVAGSARGYPRLNPVRQPSARGRGNGPEA